MEVAPLLTADEFEQLNDDDIKVLYKKKDDESYVLDVKGVLNSNKTISTKNQALSTKAQELEQKLQSLSQFEGMDFEQVQEALQAKTKIEEKKLIDKGEFEKIRLKDKEEFDKKYNADIEAKDQETQRLRGVVEKEITQRNVMEELIKQGVLREGTAPQDAVNLFMPMVKSEITDDLTVKLKIIDATGYDTGKTLEEGMAEFKQARPYLFASNGAGGIPATPNNSRNGNGATKWADMGNRERSQAISKYGSREEAIKHF